VWFDKYFIITKHAANDCLIPDTDEDPLRYDNFMNKKYSFFENVAVAGGEG
jgi:hypothetical protein